MNRIRLLPEQVANQIAAGEVIERPASVVKELVENAFDAEARRVTVEIQAGGRSLIRVTDDGVGMSRDDALLCLERHATSKIRAASDLGMITTMGFRGEALPSIASVSRMTLTTREHDAESGTQVVLHGGKISEVKAAGCAPGTAIEVRQLFFNLPARRKFLRSEETERAHVHQYLTLAALAYSEVGLIFIEESRVIWQLPAIAREQHSAQEALQERLRALYGADRKLLPVEFGATLEPTGRAEPEEQSEAAQPFRVWGFMGAPGVSRATRDEQHLFVNRRPVENRGLNYALLEGYHTALMKGRYPVCCLFIEIHPSQVDVNIHPAKREVRFRQEAMVRRFVAEAVRETLLGFHSSRSGPRLAVAPQAPGADAAPSPSVQVQPELPRTTFFQVSARAVRKPDLGKSDFDKGPGDGTQAGVRAVEPPAGAAVSTPSQESGAGQIPEPTQVEAGEIGAELAGAEPVPLLNVPLRLVGVIGKLYVVFESDRGMVLLDQHAAHERILFEQMLGRLEQGETPCQKLLLPETIELSPKDAQFLREHLSSLTRLGVSLSEFGERTFLLDGLPPFVQRVEARRFVFELIDELKATGQAVNTWRLGEQTVAKTVCRHAVKAHDPLTGPELEQLINGLRQCRMPYTCPHGRPTLIELGFRELEKKFGRIQ